MTTMPPPAEPVYLVEARRALREAEAKIEERPTGLRLDQQLILAQTYAMVAAAEETARTRAYLHALFTGRQIAQRPAVPSRPRLRAVPTGQEATR